MRRFIQIIFFVFIGLSADCQEVLVSPDINVRNDLFYDILPNINDRTVLFRNKGDEYILETLDEAMSITLSAEIKFEAERIEIFSILPFDTCFQVIYGYAKKDSIHIMSRRLNESGTLVDSTNIFSIKKKNFKRFRYQNSEDKSKTLLFARDRRDKMEFFLVDNHKIKSSSPTVLEIENLDIVQDFRKIILSNDGFAYLYFDKNNSKFSREKHKGHIFILPPFGDEIRSIEVEFNKKLIADVDISIDNKNNRILLCGLYNNDGSSRIEGYFYLNKELQSLGSSVTPNFVEFDSNFSADVIGGKRKKGSQITDFVIKDIVSRQDGGALLFFESYKELSRRSSYRVSRLSHDPLSDGGFIDYYNEDIILVNLDPEGKEDWKRVLHKKQFSQDDGAVFSSFYIFKTPSKLRLIYNDEVSKSSTISEYLINPLGDYERRAILNTEHEELKLRFTSALQISSETLIVPSERSYTLNLVKISY